MRAHVFWLALALVTPSTAATAQGRGFCAVPAHETGPDVPRFETFCKGTIWSSAKEGECVQVDADDFCRKGSTTNVDIHQYKLTWKPASGSEKAACVSTPTGVVDTVKNVPNVFGRDCNIW